MQPISLHLFFRKLTLVWLSNAQLNDFVEEFTIPFLANFGDTEFLLFSFFSLYLSFPQL